MGTMFHVKHSTHFLIL